MSDALLDVSHLTIGFTTGTTATPVVRDVSFSVRPGETLAIVGESGSGKSLTASAILRLVRPPGRILAGTVRFRGRDLLALGEHELRELRGADLALIAQEPMTSLNPVFTIGDQIAETLVVHGRADWARARGMAVDLLQAVRMPEAARRAYPHQLSGGQQQRVLIAMALACEPALLIADEPTTALDVTIQAEILDLLRDIRAQSGLALVLITHDLGVVAEMADRVAVMYAGHIVEESPVAALFASPQHPYTRGLLASTPRKGIARRRLHTIDGVVPNPGALPPGCSFEPRCLERIPACRTTDPPLYPLGDERAARCLLLEGTTR